MTVADHIKILDRKIKQNEEHYNLDKKLAKIFVLLFKNLPKYEHLTGEDLEYKSCALEQARFDYSPLSKLSNEGLIKEQKKKGL